MEITEHAVESKIAGMDEHGWSNSDPAEHAPDDVHPDVADQPLLEPGWSNRGAVTAADDTEAAEKPAKTTARKTTTAKKG